jgi:hypothetical protein
MILWNELIDLLLYLLFDENCFQRLSIKHLRQEEMS